LGPEQFTVPGARAIARLRGVAACAFAGAVALIAPFAEAQTNQADAQTASPRRAIATATTTEIVVDGALDEAAWSTAPGIGDLVQRQPDTGQPPTEETVVTVLFDRTNLYVGIQARDSQPDRVIGTVMARDASLNADDRVEILLDTFRDQRSAFYFATNPAGALVDGLVANGELNSDWDAIWIVRTRRTAQGWTAEFAIPFKSLGFPLGSTVWGFNVSRNIYRKLEDIRWSGARLETQFAQVSEAGELAGLEGLTQGIGLDLRPFLAGRWLNFRDSDPDEASGDPGLDAFYNITPSLKLTATVNTDFGETEVDARQINLTRFSLFFPEKRSFFLEGAGVFNFASIGPDPAGGIPETGADVYPFFSRRIGLLNGQEVPLETGVKLSGTVGRTDIGVLGVRTGDLEANGQQVAETKGFFVGRVKRNLFEQSYVGAIFTEGNPAIGEFGRTAGADLRLATSRLLGRSQNLVVTAYGVRSETTRASDQNWSYGFSAHYPNDKFNAQVAFREVQPNFEPALGFVQRDNVRMLRVAGSFNPRPRDFLNIQQMFHDVYYTRFTRLDSGLVESWDLYVTPIDWHLKSGDSLHGTIDFNPTYERLFESFEISPGVILPPGEYQFTRFRTGGITTAAKRRLSGSIGVAWGNYWSGEAEQWTGAITYKAPPRFIVSLSTNQTFARLPEGHFTARIVTSNVNYAASPFLAFSNLIQFDNRSQNLGWQGRIRWTLQPGRDVFFAVNQGWIHEEDGGSLRFRRQDTKLSAKFQYSVRF
jgi:Domain of unknown function (DUF5916)/Carbohydrate family 9 binding domain-like